MSPEHMPSALVPVIKELLVRSPRDVQEVLFVSLNVTHPVWKDQSTVMGLAAEQILGVAPQCDEHPLAFIGVHSKTRLTGHRDSIGWVITDRRVVAQDDMSVLFDAKPPQVFPLTAQTQASGLFAELHQSFAIPSHIDDDLAAALDKALARTLEALIPAIIGLGHLPQDHASASTLSERVSELRLDRVVKRPEDQRKLFAKLSKVLGRDDIRVCIADVPFFGGAYGLAITPSGIVSKDVGEDPVSSTWAQIQGEPMIPDDTEDGLLVGTVRHVIPPQYSSDRPAIATLINDMAVGTVN